jgi:ribosomal protein S18 acetylase RimI-like enzyme
MQEELRIMRAKESDIEEIFALYRSLIQLPYSTWSEEYPTYEMVEDDVKHHDVIIMRNDKDVIVSAIAVWKEFEFADAAPWYADVTRWAMLSRLGVHSAYQGKGIAKRMLLAAMEAAREEGIEAVQFLVAKSNPIAQRAYAKLGFDVCGEAELWEEAWLCYQKRL